jgi:hypothetical protein
MTARRTWFGVSAALYRARISDCTAEVFRSVGEGWFVRLSPSDRPPRMRGPLSSLDAAMDAVEDMIVATKTGVAAA